MFTERSDVVLNDPTRSPSVPGQSSPLSFPSGLDRGSETLSSSPPLDVEEKKGYLSLKGDTPTRGGYLI